jgi:hypothetical protein
VPVAALVAACTQQRYVLQRLAVAKNSMHFMALSYTATPIADAMVAKIKAGLVVRSVFEAQNAGALPVSDSLLFGKLD